MAVRHARILQRRCASTIGQRTSSEQLQQAGPRRRHVQACSERSLWQVASQHPSLHRCAGGSGSAAGMWNIKKSGRTQQIRRQPQMAPVTLHCCSRQLMPSCAACIHPSLSRPLAWPAEFSGTRHREIRASWERHSHRVAPMQGGQGLGPARGRGRGEEQQGESMLTQCY